MGKLIKVFLARSCSVRAATMGIASLLLLTAALFLPGTAAAVADLTNMWPATPTIVSNSNAGTVSGKFSVGIGANRVMVVAVATRYSALPGVTPVISVTYGGQPLAAGPTTGNVQNGVALFYLKDTGVNNIGLATSKTLTVTNTTTTSLTNMYATASTYNGIDQTNTIVGTGGATGLTVAAGSVAVPSYAMTGSYGLPGNESLTLYATNWFGNPNPSSVSGYTEIRDYAGTGGNINLSAGYKFSTGTGNEAPSSTATSNLGGIAAMTLNTLQKPATNNSCGDCHGNPPEDVASRGAITGMFVGSHDKHAGGNEGQYGMACTYCHYNNTTYNHSLGFKNITGSKLPGNAYTQTKKIATTNTPAMGTCNNTYCHSTGRSAAQFTAPPNWGTNGTVTCLSCHAGRVNAGGAMTNSSLGFKLSTTHMQHMKAPYTAGNVSCNICHSKTVTDAATLKQYTGVNYHANGTANVLFTNIAYASYTSYKTGSKTCSNVSCHGGKTRGSWSTSSINNDNTCVHCHGVASTLPANTDRKNYAPGWINGATGISTDGNTASSDPRVGAHYRHLSSVYMTKKIKCNECHLVPSNPYDAGHTDSPRYSSNTIVFTQASTANKNTTTPAYTAGGAATPATCNTTYCHGSKMPKGDNTGTDKSPVWNANLTAGAPSAATCGRCHGNPPTFGSSSSAHVGAVATTSCIGCHKNVVNASGSIIDKTKHLNAAVDVLVDTTLTAACNKCHGNPPQALKYGRYSGLVKPATLIMGASPANAGAHLKHQQNGMTCNTCHTNFNAGTHPDNKLQVFFRISSNTHSGWNTTSPRAPYGTYSGNSGGNAPVDTTSSTLVRGTASTNNSCNVYCHGAWNGSSRTMNPRWNDVGVANQCGKCHGASAAAPPAIGTHARHAGYSSALTARQGYSFTCTKCHPSRSASDHVKGTVHVRYSTAVLGTGASYILNGATLSTPVGSRLYNTNRLAGTTPDGSCSNISCHSTGRAAGMGTFRNSTTPTWGTTGRNCLYCHGGRASATGNPARSVKGFTLSTTHYQHLKYPAANINCQTCHSLTAKDAATLKDFSGVKRHVNNKRDVTFTPALPYGTYTSYKSTEVGSAGNTKTCNNVSCHGGKTRSAWSATTTNNDNTCLHCHGAGNGAGTALRADKYNAAPGWGGTGISTDGISANTDIRVGAHFVHLSSVYAPKIKCNECHTVPSNPFDGTHMATARYNSQTLAFSQASTATKNSVVPAFTAGTSVASATCNTTYCHGSSLKNGDTSGTNRSPQWNQDLTTGTPGAAECARCHGNPPTSGSTSGIHSGVTATTGCGGCHGMVVDGTGKIINKTLHMNGTVNAVTACNGCHSYLATDSWTTTYGGTEGVGAHIKHINYLTARYNITLNKDTDTFGGANMTAVCGVCHTCDPAKHQTGNTGAPRYVTFGSASSAHYFGAGVNRPKYNGTAGTSSSVNPKSCSNTDCHYRTSPIWSTY